jgi:hypothetical protein
MRTTATIDAGDLPPEQAEKLKQMIQDADFLHLPAVIASRPPEPDRFQYKIEVDLDGRRHAVTVSEDAMPVGLRPLIGWLMEAAKRQARHGP